MPDSPIKDILFWLAGLLALTVVLWLMVMRYRQSVMSKDYPEGLGFTFEDLDQMRDAGQITPQQHAKLRSRLIEQEEKRSKKPGPPKQ